MKWNWPPSPAAPPSRVNMKLEPAKMDWLIRTLSRCEVPMTCPHGRPNRLRPAPSDGLAMSDRKDSTAHERAV
jgi:hypothetical protein